MKTIIAGFLLELPGLIVKCVDIAQLKSALNRAKTIIEYYQKRDEVLTQSCENYSQALQRERKEHEEEIVRLKEEYEQEINKLKGSAK